MDRREFRISEQINLGEGTSVFVSPKTYNDDQWHSIEASRVDTEAILRVDGEDVSRNCRIGVCDGSATELQVRVQISKLLFNQKLLKVSFYSIYFLRVLKFTRKMRSRY